MKIHWLEYRRIVLESFILFISFLLFVILYKQVHPYTFPGIEPKIGIVLVAYLILLSLLYSYELIHALARGRMHLERHVRPAIIRSWEMVSSALPALMRNAVGTLSSALEQAYKEKVLPAVREKLIKEVYSREAYFKLGSQVVFQVLLVAFLVALLLQQLLPDLVERYINLTYLLILVIIFGIIAILTSGEEQERPDRSEPLTKKDYLLVALAGVAGTLIVWYKIQDIGPLSYLIAGISGILIILLSIIILGEEGGEEEETGEREERGEGGGRITKEQAKNK